MANDDQQRIVLLNHLVSRSTSRAPKPVTPPKMAALPFFQLLHKRWMAGYAIEFDRLPDTDDMDELTRITKGRAHTALRLRRMTIEEPAKTQPGYVSMLFELLDQQRRSFPVVHLENFEGRELSADTNETGGLSAHVMVRLPVAGEFDVGVYRCVVESVAHITRSRVESFMTRQMKREAEWTFKAEGKKGKKNVMKDYAYTPRMELHGDVARALSAGAAGNRILSHLLFTNRAEKRSIGEKVEVKEIDFVADVKVKVSAKQGPTDEAEKATWFSRVRSHFETLGYTTEVFFRSDANRSVVGGGLHHQIEGAQDLLLCPKEYITQGADHKQWHDDFHAATLKEMKALLDRDELWERKK